MSPPRTRQRLYNKGADYGSSDSVYTEPSRPSQHTSGRVRLRGREITTSEGHPYSHSFRGTDNGGNFFTQKYWMEKPEHTSAQVRLYGWSGGRYATHDVTADILVNPHPQATINLFHDLVEPGIYGFDWDAISFDGIRHGALGATPASELDAVGATLVKRVKPGESPANLAAALIELKNDGLPSLLGIESWKNRTNPQKGVGSEFLNYQFGILPLISDVRSVGEAIVSKDKHLRQLIRDNGKLVRRRLELDPMVRTTTVLREEDSSTLNLRALGLKTNGIAYSVSGFRWRRSVIQTVTDRYWFSGAFTYYLGENMLHKDALIRNASQFRWLLGLDLDLDTIYQVAPWSWAIDWFTNLGDVISNVSSFADDGLVMPYGYVMRHRHVKIEAVMEPVGPGSTKVVGFPGRTFRSVYHLDQKERRKANPFGFAIRDGDLSLKQKAILAALGLTRM